MITRRGLFKGVAAIVGSLVLNPFKSKGERVFSEELLEKASAPLKPLMVTYSTPYSHEKGFFYKTFVENGQPYTYSYWGTKPIDEPLFSSEKKMWCKWCNTTTKRIGNFPGGQGEVLGTCERCGRKNEHLVQQKLS